MAEESVGFSIRLPKSLREEIDRAAEAEGISSAKQVIRFIESGLQGDGGQAPQALLPLARKIAEIEGRTGNAWQEDVKTFGAVRKIAERWFQQERPTPINVEKIIEANDKVKEIERKLDGVLATLEDAGVIRVPQNALKPSPMLGSGLFGRPNALLQSASRYIPELTNTKLGRALFRAGFEMAFNPEIDAKDWPLISEGQPMSPENKLGLSALLAQVVPWTEQRELAEQIFFEAYREDDAELNKGAALVPDAFSEAN